jgi:hypothetical protein
MTSDYLQKSEHRTGIQPIAFGGAFIAKPEELTGNCLTVCDLRYRTSAKIVCEKNGDEKFGDDFRNHP